MGLCYPDDVSDPEGDTEEESVSAPPYSPLSCTDDDASSDETVVESDPSQCDADIIKENVHQVYIKNS